MTPADHPRETSPPPEAGYRVGCVSYLNAKPLIHGLEADPTIQLHLDVPSQLIDRLTDRQVDLALCSIVDLFRNQDHLELLPVGGIACEGPTLTVRLFSRVPVEAVTTVHADTDSHTSVMLLQVLLHDLYGITPELVHYDTRAHRAAGQRIDPSRPPEAMLLIGDKVVTDAPAATVYPYQLDLGGAWHDLTGKPFVFAAWLKHASQPLGDLAQRLEQNLDHNLQQIDQIVATHAADHGWPSDLASKYLGQILKYRLGRADLESIEFFRSRLIELQIMSRGGVDAPRIG